MLLVGVTPPSLRSPFIDLDLDRSRRRRTVPLVELVRRNRPRAEDAPRGLVFHLSRCGSTMVPEMLRGVDGWVAVSEALGINGVFELHWLSRGEQVTALRTMVELFRRQLCPEGEALVLKLSSWTTVCLDLFREAFPSTPGVFVYRDAVEVLTSLVGTPAQWWDNPDVSRRIEKGLGDRYTSWLATGGDRDRDPAAVCMARMVGEIARAAAAADDLQAVDYRTLPGSVVTDVFPRFGLRLSGLQAAQALDRALWDTKSFARRPRAFVPDSRAKRRAADPVVVEAAERFIEPHLAVLRRRRVAPPPGPTDEAT